jgi:hypothetical protein
MGSNNKKNSKFKSAFHAAEVMSHDLSLLRGKKKPAFFDDSGIQGLLSTEEIEEEVRQLKKVDVDSYIHRVVNPSESKKRPSAPEVIQQLGGKMIAEETEGPLYTAEIEFLISGQMRRLGFIAQNHKIQNGVWGPNHHRKAAEKVRFFASHSIPLVTFMDTPGAAADAEANLDNQSHSISFLLSEVHSVPPTPVSICSIFQVYKQCAKYLRSLLGGGSLHNSNDEHKQPTKNRVVELRLRFDRRIGTETELRLRSIFRFQYFQTINKKDSACHVCGVNCEHSYYMLIHTCGTHRYTIHAVLVALQDNNYEKVSRMNITSIIIIK